MSCSECEPWKSLALATLRDSFWEALHGRWGEPYPGITIVETSEDTDFSGPIWIVFRLGDTLYRKTGMYRSHDGAYWEDGALEQVEAVSTVTTVYNTVR